MKLPYPPILQRPQGNIDIMKITRLRGGNAQFPEEKSLEDIVVLGNGDVFCWDGGMWQLVGGRLIPQGMVEMFLDYAATGWPDPQSAQFDLPSLLDLSAFTDYAAKDIVPADPKMVEKFINRVVEVAERCEKNRRG
jgi:hypothetical protein